MTHVKGAAYDPNTYQSLTPKVARHHNHHHQQQRAKHRWHGECLRLRVVVDGHLSVDIVPVRAADMMDFVRVRGLAASVERVKGLLEHHICLMTEPEHTATVGIDPKFRPTLVFDLEAYTGRIKTASGATLSLDGDDVALKGTQVSISISIAATER